MKKIKYLLGFLLVGVGLLVNQSFADDNLFYIQLVNTQFSTGFVNSDYSTSYSYKFTEHFHNTCYLYDSQRLFDGYMVSNGGSSLLINKNTYSSNSPAVCLNTSIWNSSYFGFSSYSGSCNNYGTNGSLYINVNIPGLGSTNGGFSCINSPYHKVLFGKNNNFGQVFTFASLGSNNSDIIPRFGFGNNYFVDNDWLEVNSNNMNNSLRLFYNSTGGKNDLYNRDYVGVDYNKNTPIFAWEYFTNTQTLTNFGYIVDTNGWKGKHFGSMGLGYSFVYNKDSVLNGSKISWNTLGFTTVNDDILVNLRSFGGMDLINFEQTTSNPFKTEGVLVLRKNQYTNNGNEGIIVISKNPNNTHQLLYQEFSCQTNNFNCIARGQSTGDDGNLTNYCPSYIISNQSSSYNPCLVLSQGLLSFSGSTNVLPFPSKTQLISISSDSWLSSLFNTSSTILGTTSTNGNQICIENRCFDKVSSSDSIKENYLNGVYYNPYEYITTGQIENGTYELCTTNMYFAAVNYEICHGLNPSDILTISGVDYIATDIQYSNGNIVKQVIPLTDYQNGVYTASNGELVAVCNSDNPCIESNSGSIYFSGGILGTGYYSFDNTGLFFKCPYPYVSILTYLGDSIGVEFPRQFNIGSFDLLGPVNCMIAGFRHGRSLDFLDNVGLFEFGPLINGDTSQHRILFTFFDVVLSLGIILFISILYRKFN